MTANNSSGLNSRSTVCWTLKESLLCLNCFNKLNYCLIFYETSFTFDDHSEKSQIAFSSGYVGQVGASQNSSNCGLFVDKHGSLPVIHVTFRIRVPWPQVTEHCTNKGKFINCKTNMFLYYIYNTPIKNLGLSGMLQKFIFVLLSLFPDF